MSIGHLVQPIFHFLVCKVDRFSPAGLSGHRESFRNTPGTIHQMVALTDCDILEVSTPELDDVVRLSDKYGREGTSAP